MTTNCENSDTPDGILSAAGETTRAVLEEVLVERRHQVEHHRFDAAHDDAYAKEELSRAAACYLSHRAMNNTPGLWPWAAKWWNPSSNRRDDLVKAAALVVAEIERLDRQSADLAVPEGWLPMRRIAEANR